MSNSTNPGHKRSNPHAARERSAATISMETHLWCEAIRSLNQDAGIRHATGPFAIVSIDEIDDLIALVTEED